MEQFKIKPKQGLSLQTLGPKIAIKECSNVLGPEQNPQRDVDVLEIFGAGDTRDVLGPGPDVKNVRLLDPGNHEMSAFTDDAFTDAGDSVEDDSSMSAIDVVERRVAHCSGNRQAEPDLTDPGEDLSHVKESQSRKRKEVTSPLWWRPT